jgi:hypothetical protein
MLRCSNSRWRNVAMQKANGLGGRLATEVGIFYPPDVSFYQLVQENNGAG